MRVVTALAIGGVAVNFVAFSLGGKLFFDGSRRKPTFTLFAVTFISLCCVTTFLQWNYPSADSRLHAVSLGLALASLALFIKTVATTRAHPFAVIYSEGAPTRLVTRGPYRFVRHPFYTAYLLSFIASAAATHHAGAFACTLFAAAIYFTAAKNEEQRFLASPLKDSYARYGMYTGMFWPTRLHGMPTEKSA